jgi:hypothetical protein
MEKRESDKARVSELDGMKPHCDAWEIRWGAYSQVESIAGALVNNSGDKNFGVYMSVTRNIRLWTDMEDWYGSSRSILLLITKHIAL